MSNIVPTNVQVPAHLAGHVGTVSSLASDMLGGLGTGGGGGTKFKRISIRGGRFRIRDGSNETVLPSLTLETIIVGASPNTTKSYYKGAYDAKSVEESKKPDCYSTDGIRPAKDAEDPQSQLCGNCPQNIWGSKLTAGGGKMKACADQKRLAVISASDTTDDPEVYLFTVTPAVLTDFRTYVESLSNKGYSPEIVKTVVSFDTEASYPKIKFDFGGFVSEEQHKVVQGLLDADIVNEITGKTPIAATVVEAKQQITYVAPKVEVEDAVFEEAPKPAPAPTKGFGAPIEAKVTKSSNLDASILDILNDMKEAD
jgi:hypothetical protein